MTRLKLLAVLLTVTIGMASIFAVWLVLDDLTDRVATGEDRLSASESRSEANADAAAEAQAQAEALVDQVESLGQVPVVEPSAIPETAPSSSVPSVGLIQSLIDLGLAARCGGPSCKGEPGLPAPPAKDGTDGRNGVDGQTPSTELLLSLIQPLIPAPIPGNDGVGVLSITCTSPTPFPVSFDFALTNGSVQSVACPPVTDPDPTDPPVEVLP